MFHAIRDIIFSQIGGYSDWETLEYRGYEVDVYQNTIQMLNLVNVETLQEAQTRQWIFIRVGGGWTRWHTDGTKKLQHDFFGPGEAGDEKNCKVNPVTFCFLGNFGRVTFHF